MMSFGVSSMYWASLVLYEFQMSATASRKLCQKRTFRIFRKVRDRARTSFIASIPK